MHGGEACAWMLMMMASVVALCADTKGKAIHRINIQNKKSSNKVITKIGNKHTKSTARRSLEES